MRVSFILFVLLNNWNLSSSAVTGPSTIPVTTTSPNISASSSVGLKTSLESVHEDLSIVNRVINALALQNAALTGTVKHQEVVTEMLKVRLEDFTELINLSPDPVLATIQKHFDHSDSSKHVDADFIIKYRDFNNLVNTGINNLQLFENISQIDFAKVLDFSSQKLDDVFGCETDVLKAFKDFRKFEKSVGKPSARDITDQLNSLKKNSELIVKCLQNRRFSPDRTEPAVVSILKKLKEVNKLKKSLTRFDEYQEFIQNYGANFKQLSDEVDRLNGTWLASNDSGVLMHAMEIYKRIVDPNVRINIHLTAGLEKTAADISRVLEDVRSPWFREKVARGKDVETLAAALTPIQGIAKSLGKLGYTWKQVNQMFEMDNDIIEAFANSLQNVESYGDPKLASTFLATTKSLFDNCKPNTTVSLSNTTIANFEDAYKKIDGFFGNVNEIHTQIVLISKSFDYSELIGNLNQVTKYLPTSLKASKATAKFRSLQKYKPYLDSLPFLDFLEVLSAAQASASDALNVIVSAKIKPSAFEDVAKVSESIGYMPMMRCYEGTNLDTGKFGEVVGLVTSMHELTDSQVFNATKTYLVGIKTIQSDYGELKKRIHGLRSKRASVNFEPVLKLKNPHKVSLQLAEGLAVIREMVRVQKQEDVLREPYSSDVLNELRAKDPSEFWKNPMKTIEALLTGIENLEKTVSSNRTSANLTTIWTVFSEAEKVPGIPNHQQLFANARILLAPSNTKSDYKKAIHNAEELEKWDLDFASQKKALGSAYLVYNPIAEYFDDVFGFKKQSQQPASVIVYKDPPVSIKSHLGTVGICIGIFLLIIIGVIIGYGFTKKGKERYKSTYLYYFPDYKEFERRWRYSLFLDRENGDNALLDASREINPENVEIALKKGAYVNVYNIHGNTALHMATNKGFAAIVELLIRNGADRSLLNYRNKLPEQFIPEDYKELRNAASFTKIKQIYDKNRNKNYRMQVPRVLATHMFHIFIEKRTEDNLTNSFMAKYPGITSEEPLLTTTHCVCKTSSDGILETDDFELLSWIFHGVIMVKESWMEVCIRNNKTIREDYNFLIEHVRYQGSLYKNCILPWSQARAKGTMPFLCGVAVTIVMVECPLLGIYLTLIKALGGDTLNDFPDPENYNPGSHPYLHANRGPLFVIHDGKTDLSAYAKHPMFSLFTESEFIDFLLKREVHQDKSPDPIQIQRVIPTQ